LIPQEMARSQPDEPGDFHGSSSKWSEVRGELRAMASYHWPRPDLCSRGWEYSRSDPQVRAQRPQRGKG